MQCVKRGFSPNERIEVEIEDMPTLILSRFSSIHFNKLNEFFMSQTLPSPQ